MPAGPVPPKTRTRGPAMVVTIERCQRLRDRMLSLPVLIIDWLGSWRMIGRVGGKAEYTRWFLRTGGLQIKVPGKPKCRVRDGGFPPGPSPGGFPQEDPSREVGPAPSTRTLGKLAACENGAR